MADKVTAENGGIRICVDRVEGALVRGRAFSRRLTGPMSFSDLGSLLLQLERLLEEQNFPQAFQRSRSFADDARESRSAGLLPEGGMSEEAVARAAGERATLTLHICTRRMSTWQGVVNWLDQGTLSHFASDLELLRLLEDKLLTA